MTSVRLGQGEGGMARLKEMLQAAAPQWASARNDSIRDRSGASWFSSLCQPFPRSPCALHTSAHKIPAVNVVHQRQ